MRMRFLAVRLILIAASSASSSSIFAQDAVVAPEQARILNAPTQSSSESAQPVPEEVTPGYGTAVSGVQRRLQYSLRLIVRGVYDDNIGISSFNPMSDYYFAIEPSIYVGMGTGEAEGSNALSLIYRPSIYLFVDQSDRDTVQHIVRLQGQHQFGKLAVSLLQDIQALDGTDLNSINDPTGHNANVDVGRAAQHQIYTTVLGASYDLTSKTFLSGGANYTRDDYQSGNLITSQQVSGSLFFNYNYSPKLVLGIGGSGGFNSVDAGSPDQTFEQASVRIGYNATAKVSLSAFAGVEFREFGGNGRGLFVSPVYQLNGTYRPFDGTAISITGSRNTMNSASIGGTDYAATSISVDLDQRFLTKLTLGLSAGYSNFNYFSTIAGFSVNRDDNFYYIQPSIGMSVTRFWSVGAYYLRRENNSSFGFLFGFEDNQVGMSSTVVF